MNQPSTLHPHILEGKNCGRSSKASTAIPVSYGQHGQPVKTDASALQT